MNSSVAPQSTRRLGLDPAWRTAAVAWVVSRLVVAAAYLATKSGWFSDFAVGDAQADHGLLLWDGTWYRDLLDGGYDAARPDMQRFFPLYHLVGRAVDAVVSNAAVSLVIVSNVAALVALWAMYRLVVASGFAERIACRSVWWLAMFPAAASLTFAYSESLSIALGVVAVWALIERRWWVAIPAAFLVGLSRSVGAMICVALCAVAVEELWSAWRRLPDGDRSIGALLRRRSRWLAGAGATIAAPAVAFAAYMLWLRATFGTWDAPLESQRQFRDGWRDPFTRLASGLFDVVTGDGTDVFNVAFALVAIVVIVVAARRAPWWASASVVATLVVALSANNINSLGRYVLAAFPIALLLALGEERVVAGRDARTVRAINIAATTASGLAMIIYCLFAWSGRMIP
ncbi:MAG: hypothetical protein GX868_14610 [Actinobacteria bacterium]|nr:hypothetical protein [Actinomycetota bacterium]